MRKFTTLGLAVLLTVATGCSGKSDVPVSGTTTSSTGSTGSTSPDQEASTWSDGDTIPSGTDGVPDIQILKVHGKGSGSVCGTGKHATLKYKAMLANGTVLDPGTRPYSFMVGTGNAIQGWHVVVAKMRVGDSFTILLPHQLAYGPDQGDLKFDMELLSFK